MQFVLFLVGASHHMERAHIQPAYLLHDAHTMCIDTSVQLYIKGDKTPFKIALNRFIDLIDQFTATYHCRTTPINKSDISTNKLDIEFKSDLFFWYINDIDSIRLQITLFDYFNIEADPFGDNTQKELYCINVCTSHGRIDINTANEHLLSLADWFVNNDLEVSIITQQSTVLKPKTQQ